MSNFSDLFANAKMEFSLKLSKIQTHRRGLPQTSKIYIKITANKRTEILITGRWIFSSPHNSYSKNEISSKLIAPYLSIYQKQPEGYFPNDKTEENLSHQIFILLFLDFPFCLFSMVGYKLPVDFLDVFLIQLPFIYQAEFHGISHEYFLRFFTAKKNCLAGD